MGSRIFTGLALWLTVIAIYVGAWLVSPGYVIPFYNHPIARLIIIIGFVLHTGACLIYTFAQLLNFPSFLKFGPMILMILTTLAMVLLPTLGPAFITISQALGPMASP